MAKQKVAWGVASMPCLTIAPLILRSLLLQRLPKEQERRVPEPLSEEPAQKKQESAGVLHQALQERTASVPRGKRLIRLLISIFPKTRLKNAKVVSREARKPAMRAGSGTFSPLVRCP